jgi:RNA recognition motif-containing protein
MKDATMGKKIYVGNLSYETSDAGLTDLFAAHGQVLSAKTIVDRDTGRSKGFAFIEMGTEDEARSAIAALNGVSLDGRQIKVNESIDKPRDNARDNYRY